MKFAFPAIAMCFAIVLTTQIGQRKSEIIMLSTDETILMESINQERVKNGRQSLHLDERLVAIAREKAQDLEENNYFQHKSEELGTAKDMLRREGIIFYHVGGENIARGYGTPNEIVQVWMKSDGHRYNILKDNYKRTGIGVEKGEDGIIYCAQIFID